MASVTVVKIIGSTGTFSTPQLWEDGAPADLTTAERSAAGTFSGTFVQGESLSFVGSGATGKFLDSDHSTYVTYGITAGNPAASDTVTGATATCVLLSGTPDFTGVIWQGQCQNQEFTGTNLQLAAAGSTSSSTAYKEITTVAGASFRDNANVQTNALQYNASNGCGIRRTDNGTAVSNTENFLRISKLQISSIAGSLGSAVRTDNEGLYDFLILEGSYTSASTFNSTAAFNAAATVRNTAIILRASAATQIVATFTGSPSFYNCTITASDDHATAPTEIFNSGTSGTVTVQNCGLFAGDATKALVAGSATFNFTTCYSDISGTAGVTQTTYSSEFQNVNDATRDFRLVTGAAQKDTGTTDATNAANDIAGTARPSGAAYDVGAWEFVIPFVSPLPQIGRKLYVMP